MTLLWHESWSLSPNIAIPFDYLHFSMAKSKRACHLWTLLPVLLRFLLTFSTSVFILGPRIHQESYFQLTWVGILQDRRSLGFPLSGIPICGTCIFFAEFPAAVLSKGSCCSEPLWVFLSFSLHISDSFCLERFSVSTGQGRVGHITSWQSCSALGFELVKFFVKV